MADMQVDIIPGRFDPVNFFNGQQKGFLVRVDQEPLGILRTIVQLLEQAIQFFGEVARPAPISTLNLAPSVVKNFLKSRLIERLEQIIERVDFERFQGEMVVSRDEDHLRQWSNL